MNVIFKLPATADCFDDYSQAYAAMYGEGVAGRQVAASFSSRRLTGLEFSQPLKLMGVTGVTYRRLLYFADLNKWYLVGIEAGTKYDLEVEVLHLDHQELLLSGN